MAAIEGLKADQAKALEQIVFVRTVLGRSARAGLLPEKKEPLQ